MVIFMNAEWIGPRFAGKGVIKRTIYDDRRDNAKESFV